ncbi:MAG: hypothetical protein DWH91_17800 [Planctomycetota bacterium]|nr:MAG: hypothetical protein DWH91_17800 [Planctomycetota bacterium]
MKALDDSLFSRDSEFQKLLVGRRDVDVTRAALELARDFESDLDFQPTLDWIQNCADELTAGVASAATDRIALERLADSLANRYGLHGTSECFEAAESSLLPCVIESRQGLPITLSILYCAVAERLGIPLTIAPAPQHVICRLVSDQTSLFVDPFNSGRILTEEECYRWIQERTQLERNMIGPTLRPASPRMVIERMLMNLKNLYVQQEMWDRLWPVQYRLALLNPSSVEARRDLGITAAEAGRPGLAIDLLRECLPGVSGPEKEFMQRAITAAESRLAKWN